LTRSINSSSITAIDANDSGTRGARYLKYVPTEKIERKARHIKAKIPISAAADTVILACSLSLNKPRRITGMASRINGKNLFVL